jgi:SPP1 family predicted phage head-tail adaptor
MRAGKLDNTIEIRRKADDGVDEYGNPVPGTVSTVATLRAQIVQASTDEFIRAWGANDETVIIFRTRWLDDMTLSDTVRHDGVDFNLKEIKPIGRRRGLELRAVAA